MKLVGMSVCNFVHGLSDRSHFNFEFEIGLSMKTVGASTQPSIYLSTVVADNMINLLISYISCDLRGPAPTVKFDIDGFWLVWSNFAN
jgi:hypothetical protein